MKSHLYLSIPLFICSAILIASIISYKYTPQLYLILNGHSLSVTTAKAVLYVQFINPSAFYSNRCLVEYAIHPASHVSTSPFELPVATFSISDKYMHIQLPHWCFAILSLLLSPFIYSHFKCCKGKAPTSR